MKLQIHHQGAGALSHANYLWNAAVNGDVLNTSWHFTMDDKQLYQHIPVDEIAYHAGDKPGGTLPVVGAEPCTWRVCHTTWWR